MGTFSVIDGITIVFSVAAAIFSIFTWVCSIRHERKQATLAAYNQLQEQVLDHLYLYSRQEIQKIAEDPRSEEYKQISFYVARIEHFCVGVNQKIYDQHIVYELAHGFLDRSIRNRIRPMLEQKSRGSEEFYSNTKLVLSRMDQEFEKRARKK